MRRGDIYWVDLEPVEGSEANKTRPAVIVSNDAANQTAERTGRGVVTVVPVTSNTHRVYPFQVLLPAGDSGLASDSKAQAEQVRAVATGRLGERAGSVPGPVLRQLDDALRIHLALLLGQHLHGVPPRRAASRVRSMPCASKSSRAGLVRPGVQPSTASCLRSRRLSWVPSGSRASWSTP